MGKRSAPVSHLNCPENLNGDSNNFGSMSPCCGTVSGLDLRMATAVCLKLLRRAARLDQTVVGQTETPAKFRLITRPWWSSVEQGDRLG
jgi:hypothetical protein